MSISAQVAVTSPPPFFTGARHARSAVEALAKTSRPPRAFIVGAAGSGKSALLRHLQGLLVDRQVPVVVLEEGMNPERLPPSQVLVIDDLQRLDAARADAVLARSADPGAALVVASRPWPRSETLTAISRRLGASVPPIVLGEVARSDVLAHLADQDESISVACVDLLLKLTGGVAWLVSRALALHDDRDCNADPSHEALRRALEAEVAHRLDTVDAPLRRLVEAASLHLNDHVEACLDIPLSTGELIAQGHADGLLLRSGGVVPVVRSAVRAGLPIHLETEPGEEGNSGIGAALVAHADRVVANDPARASELYGLAIVSGVPQGDLILKRGHALWAGGQLDAAARFVEAALVDPDPTSRDGLIDTAAAVWAARGMPTTSSDVYNALVPRSVVASTRAVLAHVGIGAPERLQPHPPLAVDTAAPSTLGVAMRLLDAGLRSSLERDPGPSTLVDLVRASELYTSSRATAAITELPAVVAVAASVGAGDLVTARNVIDAAVIGNQGGSWARARLLLWQAWVALQSERPVEARESLALAEQITSGHSPRDELLLQTIRVGLARRYDDVQTLEATWQAAVETIRHLDVDLFTLLPWSSLVAAGARVADATTLAPQFARGLDILQRLGLPPLWSTHLWWAGIQQGILLNRPKTLNPYARALVTAAPHNHVAATMAQAGGVWMAVLGGSVDPDAVESAARALASAGLAWDGARLAGHGAGRTQDRKVAARLLSCARELHPPDAARKLASAEEGESQSPEGVQLSDRELDVARLVLQGKTYAEIGETIFISPRTVEHHVASIRRRLDATSRSDLIAKLRLTLESSSGVPPAAVSRRSDSDQFP